MLGRLAALFQRYATSHVRMRLHPFALRDEAGQIAGYVERAEVAGGALHVSGWAVASRVSVVMAGQEVSAVPAIRREDVHGATGLGPEVGFDLLLPCSYGALRASEAPGIRVERETGVAIAPRPLAPRGLPRRVVWVAYAGFALALCRALPWMARWGMKRDRRARDGIKRALRLAAPETVSVRLDPVALRPAEVTRARADTSVTIIVPVYNAFDMLGGMLGRVTGNTDLDWRLILVEDGSTDERVRPFLRDFADGRERVTLVENEANMGFIRSVNRAFALALEEGEGPVILLNSDAFVPAGWASRLVAPLEDDRVASVTPMSNDAEIFTAPVICAPAGLPEGAVDAIDRSAQDLCAGAAPVVAPTGVGFCMAIARDWLARFPEFDTAFGRGYGEEVDWCQKVRAAGGRHLGLPSLFVEHRGGGSFGSEAKRQLVARNNATVARRYPSYDQEVQDFIAADPLLTPRLALALAAVGAQGGHVPVYLAHTLGGGAEHDLARRIEADRATGYPSVVLRVGGPERWQVEVTTPEGHTAGATTDGAALRRLMSALPAKRIVYSCGVGDPDPVQIPALLREISGPDDRIEILFHDFFPLSPSYTLLDADGVFRGPPPEDTRDPAHATDRPDGTPVTLPEWRRAWRRLAEAAQELCVFSEDSADHVRAVWPDLADRIAVRPHTPARLPGKVARTGGRPVLASLGNLNRAKGAEVMQCLGNTERPFGLLAVGNVDPAYPLPKSVTVTGSYSLESLGSLVAAHGITHWLIPSVWPETFSFTTREALATGLPVLCFDLGAQGAAVGRAANGHVVPLAGDAEAAARAVVAVMTRIDTPQEVA